MGRRDYYQVLGLQRNCTTDQVKVAFRAIALKTHPDRNPGDKRAEAAFKDAAEAYTCLSDPKLRSEYDRSPRSVSDIESMFGFPGTFVRSEFGQSWWGGRVRGADINTSVTIDFVEAITGCSRDIRVQWNGGMSILSISIPPGVENDVKLRLSGRGEPGPGIAPAGNLYVTVNINTDERFSRDGFDLHSVQEVQFTTMVFGGEVNVDVPGGSSVVRLRPGSQASESFILRGFGYPDIRNGGRRGDLHVMPVVIIPKSLTEEQDQILRQYSETVGLPVANKKRGFFR